MLVLSRNLYEEIVATTPSGEEIVFKILRIGEQSVRVGITAAKDVAIHRREVHDRIAEADVLELVTEAQPGV